MEVHVLKVQNHFGYVAIDIPLHFHGKHTSKFLLPYTFYWWDECLMGDERSYADEKQHFLLFLGFRSLYAMKVAKAIKLIQVSLHVLIK